MLTVACVLKSGGLYTAEWVGRLQRAVAEHLSAEHHFVCLSDIDVPCDRLPLAHGWPGWWSKLEMFRLTGRALFLDLDVAVVGDLDRVLDWPSAPFDERSFGGAPSLTAVRDFYHPAREFNSSVMLFESRADIYGRFLANADQIMATWRGDQEWLSASYPEAHVWRAPPIASFKKHCRSRIGVTMPPPVGTSIVAFHGRPKMHEAEGWPRDYWLA